VPNGGPCGDFVPWLSWPRPGDAGNMPVFWRKKRGVQEGRRARWHPSEVEGAGSYQPHTAPVFEDADWDQVHDLLAGEDPPTGPCPSEKSINAATSLCQLRASLTSQVLPAGRVMDRVLDVWAAAHEVAPGAATPAESLLTSLVGRDLVSAREVTDMCDRVEAALKANKRPAGGGAVAPIKGPVPCQPTGASISSKEGAR
jgi:hypothetical protein